MYTSAKAVAIRELSAFESDETESDRQRGILIKSLIALAVNWILNPVVIGLMVNQSFYDSKGIVYFVFFLSITNALIPPFLRCLDPLSLFKKVRGWWKNRPCTILAIKTRRWS
jgi:hypothetical protein